MKQLKIVHTTKTKLLRLSLECRAWSLKLEFYEATSHCKGATRHPSTV